MADDQTAADPVEIWVRIEKDEHGFPESQDWEDLWAWPMRDGLVRVLSIPFFAKGIATGDVARTIEADGGFTALQSVVERSGDSTFRIWLHDQSLPLRDQIISKLGQLGARVEVTLDRLIAIDAPAEHEAPIWDYLEQGKRQNAWGLQVGHSPD